MAARRYDLRTLNELASLSGGEPVTITVRGACMGPHVRDGQHVQVQRARMPLPGDLLAIHDGEQILVHRFIGAWPSRQGWKYVTRADTATRPDTAVTRERVLGQVMEPGTGRPLAVSFARRLRATVQFLLFCGRRAIQRLGL